jgi:hypothetical protein
MVSGQKQLEAVYQGVLHAAAYFALAGVSLE